MLTRFALGATLIAALGLGATATGAHAATGRTDASATVAAIAIVGVAAEPFSGPCINPPRCGLHGDLHGGLHSTVNVAILARLDGSRIS